MYKISLLLFPLLFLGSCADPGQPVDESRQTEITVSNPLDVARTDELVVITRDQLPEFANEGELAPLLKTTDGAIPAQQYDDLDGDGAWDEVAVLLDLPANGEITLMPISVAAADYPEFDRRTSIRMGVLEGEEYLDMAEHTRPATHKAHDPLYHVEGVSWENDKIGFRNYFDERNGKDIFGKRIPGMVLDTVDLGSGYHELGDWGMDILKVGNSLGAGALGALVDGQPVRLGATRTASYRRIVRGPVRSIFELRYTGWPVGGDSLDLTETVTMTAGNNYYKSSVVAEGYEGDLPLITGIVNLESEAVFEDFGSGTVGAFATWDQQSYIEDGLGMAIIYPRQARSELVTAPEEGDGITQTFYGVFPTPAGEAMEFYFVAGWETADPAFGTEQGFRELVDEYVTRLGAPLGVAVR